MRIPRGTLSLPIAIATACVLSGCGGSGNQTAPSSSNSSTTTVAASSTTTASSSTTTTTAPPDATAVAKRVKAGVSSVTKLVTITEDNDPNDKIGRPGGYVSAATMYDSGA